MAGSDQIWNPYYLFNSHIEFMDFATKSKRISYAASFGVDKIPNNKISTYKKWLEEIPDVYKRQDIDGTTKPEYLCRFIADKAETILPVSKYIKNHFNSVAPNEKMKVLYNCIDLNVFNVNRKYNTEELKNKYGLNNGDFVYLYTGRICPEKGILELVRAFKKIVKENKNAKLVVCLLYTSRCV